MNCILILYFSTHVAVAHGGQLPFSDTHSNVCSDDHHSHPCGSPYFHEYDHDHHIDHHHSHPNFVRVQQRTLTIFEMVHPVDLHSGLAFTLSTNSVNYHLYPYANIPPPDDIPIYLHHCSFLI